MVCGAFVWPCHLNCRLRNIFANPRVWGCPAVKYLLMLAAIIFFSFSFCNPHLCGYAPADETHQRFGLISLPTGYHVFHMRDCGLVGLWFNFHPFGGCGLGGGIGKAHCWVAFPLCQGWHYCLCWLVHPTIVLSLLLALQISLHDIWVGRAHG